MDLLEKGAGVLLNGKSCLGLQLKSLEVLPLPDDPTVPPLDLANFVHHPDELVDSEAVTSFLLILPLPPVFLD